MPDTTTPSTAPTWIAGASGLVGRALLEHLLASPGRSKGLHLLLRREIPGLPAAVKQHRVDFSALPESLPSPATAFICLGTTIRQAGSQEAFRAVDFEAVLAVARAARAAGAKRCAVVSALGANAQSSVFYNRVKGETERALAALSFERLVLARPSLLIGDRTALGQPERPGERWGLMLSKPLGGLIPARWRPIEATTVARAMLAALEADGPPVQILESDALQRLGRA